MSMELKIRTSKRLAKSKERRDAFVASHIREGLCFQIRALRKQRKWTQKDLGKKARFNQSKVSDFENPNYSSDLNLDTVKRLASAFDVAVIVRFVSFSGLIGWVSDLAPSSLEVPSFDDDRECLAWLSATQTLTENAPALADAESTQAVQAVISSTLAELLQADSTESGTHIQTDSQTTLGREIHVST